MHKAFDIKTPIFKSMWLLYKKDNEYESIHVSSFKRKWAWTSKMTEQISAIWMFEALLCNFKKVFLQENTIFTLKQLLFINV